MYVNTIAAVVVSTVLEYRFKVFVAPSDMMENTDRHHFTAL